MTKWVVTDCVKREFGGFPVIAQLSFKCEPLHTPVRVQLNSSCQSPTQWSPMTRRIDRLQWRLISCIYLTTYYNSIYDINV